MNVESYKDLQVWQKAMDLVELVYMQTKTFPKEEQYGLVAQLRRAVVSIPSNIAEGSSIRSTKEFIRFITISYGSLAEVETQLLIAERLGFSRNNEIISKKISELGRMLNGLQRSLEKRLVDVPSSELRTLKSGI